MKPRFETYYNFNETMVEAMYYKSPDYFKQFAEDFVFIIVEEAPHLEGYANFIYGLHESNDKKIQCPVKESSSHYHLLTERSVRCPGIRFNIKCLYSVFEFMVVTTNARIRLGPIIEQLSNAVKYNHTHNVEMSAKLKRKLSEQVQSQKPTTQIAKFDKAVQTTQLPSATLDRFLKAINGPNSVLANHIIDLLNSNDLDPCDISEIIERF